MNSASRRPVIVITSWGRTSAPTQPPVGPPAPPAAEAPVRWETLPSAYAHAVVLAGGTPILLPNTADAEAVEATMDLAAGLLLSGGGDVAPGLYGQAAHPATANVDEVRDATEKRATEIALARGLPVLAICRGIQFLNVVLGGTLIQDIPSWRQSATPPPAMVQHSGATHDIRVETGCLLSRLWEGRSPVVNSTHHQAVDRVADGLRATAWAPDGIVEAAESANGRRILAVQFHPERLAARQPDMLAPFRWLAGEAASG